MTYSVLVGKCFGTCIPVCVICSCVVYPEHKTEVVPSQGQESPSPLGE